MPAASTPQTLFEKIWIKHRILEREDGQELMFVDTHMIQDGSAPAFEMLRQRKLTARSPERAFGTPDHYLCRHHGRSRLGGLPAVNRS